MSDNLKQVIVVRSDLKMSLGKIAVEVAHAAVSAAERTKNEKYEWWEKWIKNNQKKVVLKVKDANELLKLYNEALSANLPAVLIYDAGLTELPPNTLTCLGIGPAPSNLINRITKHLELLRG
ncbi:MAG: peptidyl-tRNA hydrolase Pth2 [Candidatus Methanomethylicia archaeon]|nr:peptidyl-tRNA hydrolase Pth2 [Candidatus Methanomethylicia archaeon]MCX8169322.1 peptidyl-tRNA hydrolase Pth2 [Candidatus Methanomethylicia archaeon]MDW7988895.1 peptidyl-tRNA hydrolase Pth2 [Nitrososphaerota archaeon]